MKKIKTTQSTKLNLLPFEIIVHIFSFISENNTCVYFSLINKYNKKVFFYMMERSSTLLYRLNFLNGKKPKDYCFDVFKSNGLPNVKIDKRFYVQNIKDFEVGIKEVDIVKICAKINKNYGEVAMIAGGYTLQYFIKEKNYDAHSNNLFEDRSFDLYNEFSYSECRDNINIFIFGNNKTQIANEILKEYKDIIKKKYYFIDFSDYFNDYINIKIYALYTINNFNPINNFNLILKGNAETPNDIFSFFDLDICKIGYFPSLEKVVVPVDFFRSMSCGKNYLDIVFKKINKEDNRRISKYFYRTGIRTTIQKPPLLSYYHGHTKQRFCKNIIKLETSSTHDFYNIPYDRLKKFGLVKLNNDKFVYKKHDKNLEKKKMVK